jgi:hypothetical protein
MILVTPDQRTAAWATARLGRLTGSSAGDMLTTIKTGEAAKRRDLRLRLVCERLTQLPQENGYVSKDMQRGIDMEATARAVYEATTGLLVREVGFVAHDTLEAGCSPDGEIRDYTGILEIKCPKAATHLGYVRAGAIPPEYRPQIVHNLWITGAAWCDFVSYDDRFPVPLRFVRVRVLREHVDLLAYELAARLFLSEVDRELAEVQQLLDRELEKVGAE